MRFTCAACGAADVISLGAETEVTCPACNARRPRADYVRALAEKRARGDAWPRYQPIESFLR